jgi:hypothetical protein
MLPLSPNGLMMLRVRTSAKENAPARSAGAFHLSHLCRLAFED